MSDIENIIDSTLSNASLFQFQENVVKEISTRFYENIIEGNGSKHHCDVLESITGSGKTVMLIKALDCIYKLRGDRKINFFWFSYDRELNEQTFKRFKEFSNRFDDLNIEVISIHNLSLNDDNLWFLNGQKLTTTSNLFKSSESMGGRNFYEILADLPEGNIRVLIVDECHRGTGKEDTILSQVIDSFNPNYLIAASATPEDFDTFFEKKRVIFSKNKIKVLNEDVKESGMIKSRIEMLKTEFNGYSDSLTKLVMEDYVSICSQWERYIAAYPEEKRTNKHLSKSPAMMVQVTNNFEESMNMFTGLVEAIVKNSSGLVSYKNIFHTLGDVGDVKLHNRDGDIIRKIKQSEINDNKDLKVVIFKENLVEGVDIPRVEILYSIRPVKNKKDIVQLIGRIIRNPFMKEIEDEEFLSLMNVSFYAPNYDRELSRDIISGLNNSFMGIASAREVSESEKNKDYFFKYDDSFVRRINEEKVPTYQKDTQSYYDKILSLDGEEGTETIHDSIVTDLYRLMESRFDNLRFDKVFKGLAVKELIDTNSYLTSENSREYDITDSDLKVIFEKKFINICMLTNGEDIESSKFAVLIKKDKGSEFFNKVKNELSSNGIKKSLRNIVITLCIAYDNTYGLINEIESLSKRKYENLDKADYDNKHNNFTLDYREVRKSLLPSTIKFVTSSNSALKEVVHDGCIINKDSQAEVKVIPYLDENFSSWARNFVDAGSIKIKYTHDGKNRPFNPDFYGYDNNDKFTIIETKELAFADHINKLKGALRYCAENHYGLLWIIETNGVFYRLNSIKAMNNLDEITKENVIERFCFPERLEF